jgi:hypothetical protein
MLYSTYLGGANFDMARAVAVDGLGRLIVAGYTASPDFPTTPDAFDTTYNGGEYDGFIAILEFPENGGEPDTTHGNLIYSTFFGGSGFDWVNELILSSDGRIIIAGGTDSPDLPTTPGAWDRTHNGDYDAWIAVMDIDPGSTPPFYSTYLGGAGHDWANHLTLTGTGAILVSGRAASADFPTTPGAFDRSYNGGAYDGFVAGLDRELGTLLSATLLGGEGIDAAKMVTIEPDGDVIVAGWTRSAAFPSTPGTYDPTYNGGWDAFVTRMDVGLTMVKASTFIGTGGEEGVNGIARDGLGGINVVGSTDDPDYPTTEGAEHPDFGGGTWDGFITRLDDSLAALSYSSFLGSPGSGESAIVVFRGEAAEVTVGGLTDSPEFDTTIDAYDRSFNGVSDTFIAQFDYCPADLDHNGTVDIRDMFELLLAWGEVGSDADFDGDGVGATDFIAMLQHWGPCS